MNTQLILCVILAITMILMLNKKTEPFSKSGLNMSDRYCNNLVDGYYNPQDNNPENRNFYRQRVCSPLRRIAIDHGTGNYFKYGGRYY